MIENSLILSFIVNVYHYMVSIYENSFISRIIEGIYGWLKSVFENSLLFKCLDIQALSVKEFPWFIRKIQKFYSWIILGLHAWYKRVVKSSRIVNWAKDVLFGKWLANSVILRPFKAGAKGVTVEAILIGFILFMLPLLPDSLMLIGCFAALGLFLIIAVVTANDQLNFNRVLFVIGLFALLLVGSSVFSISFGSSFRDLMLHVGGLFLLFIIVNSRMNDQSWHFVIHMISFVGLVLGLYAIYQFVTEVPMGSGWVDPTSNPDIKTRVFATFENPNLFSEYILMIFPLSVAMIFLSRNILMKLFSCGVAGILGISMFLTYSRAGFVAMALATGIFVIMVNAKFIVPFIFGGGISLFFLPQSIIDRLMTIVNMSDSSSAYRINLWNYTLNIINDFWQTGIGLGYLTFRMITPYYMKNMAPYHSHNTFLQITVELGIVGLIVFVWLLIDLFRQSLHSVRSSSSKTVKMLSGALIGGLIGLMVQGMAEHVLYNPKIIVMFWIVVAMIIKLGIEKEEPVIEE